MDNRHSYVVLLLVWYWSQSAAQDTQCICKPHGNLHQCSLYPPIADKVYDAEQYCSTSWTCKNGVCAYYEHDAEKDDAVHFEWPVRNATFETVVMESAEHVHVSVSCPEKGIVIGSLLCPYERPSTPPPSSTPSDDVTTDPSTSKTSPQMKTIGIGIGIGIGIVILTIIGVVILKRRRRGQSTNQQDRAISFRQLQTKFLKKTHA